MSTTATAGRTVEAVLLRQYPIAYQLAVGLCGDDAAAVANRVLERAVLVAGRWASDLEAERWFLRFTVLASREICGGRRDDATLAWPAALARQQREAVVLVHGLRLDLHRAAAAMDCSSGAAANHLVSATAVLRAAGLADAWTAGLPMRLAAVVPPAVALSAQVARATRRQRWRVWVRKGLAILLFAGFVAVLWLARHLWRMLVV